VGAGADRAGPVSPSGPPWQVLRGFSAGSDSAAPHRGADLGDGRAGDPVRAAAAGVVVVTSEGARGEGFGSHVVLAHRLSEGGICCSVYSHLKPGSTRVRAGQRVWAGDPLGLVGRSGHASTDHLHFEIRMADEPDMRWEKMRAVDPMEFIGRRLQAPPDDSTWTALYLGWAEQAGLLSAADRRLDHRTWERMLARAARLPVLELPGDPRSLRRLLIEEGALPDREHAALDRLETWSEIARDLACVRALGVRLPPIPTDSVAHRRTCLARLGSEHPARGLRDGTPEKLPTIGDACLLLADLAAEGAGPEAPAPGR